MQGLLAGLAIHAFSSILVGLLYGAMLPMFPRRPILMAGFIAPLIWTGILYTALGIVSPILDQRIHWLWFIVSQFAFGLVAGYVVNLQVKVRSAEFRALPFAVRAGLHTCLLYTSIKPEFYAPLVFQRCCGSTLPGHVARGEDTRALRRRN